MYTDQFGNREWFWDSVGGVYSIKKRNIRREINIQHAFEEKGFDYEYLSIKPEHVVRK